MSLPLFTPDGVLPVGDYQMTFDELRESHLVTGNDVQSGNWDSAWRSYLVENMGILVNQLWQVGIDRIFINGSFVEDKDHPNDIDGYFECNLLDLVTGRLEHSLNAIDPYKVWTWDPQSRRPHPNSIKHQLPVWHQYRVELYPHCPGLLTGIQDQFGNDLTFPSAFRLSRNAFTPKGIVQIVKHSSSKSL